jgi:HD-GYP domain-containing protein (c-di-GMP phosphodiesterase class II)
LGDRASPFQVIRAAPIMPIVRVMAHSAVEVARPGSVDSDDGLVEESRARVVRALGTREFLPTFVTAAAFVATAAILLAWLPVKRVDAGLGVTLALVLCYAVATRIQFEAGFGVAIPTQLVFVPMLFLAPLRTVPLLVVLGFFLSTLPELVRGEWHVGRAAGLHLVSGWHAVGPVLVLAAFGAPSPTLRYLPVVALALVAQFALDFASSAWRGVALGMSPASLIKTFGPAWLVDAALTPLGFALAYVCVGQPYAFVLGLPLMGLLAYFARERKARIDNALELSSAYRGTAFLLGDVVEADDAYTGLHSRDVVSLVTDVCDRLGVTGAERRDAEFAALLHDVGKIRIPAEIINKPGKLTDEEFAVIKTHTVEGEKLLAQVGGILGNVGRIVRSCHEDWDGTGYPDGLVGEQIPRVARIVRCCDAYSAMTTDRSYRKALPVPEAVAELQRCSGTDFDPTVVAALDAVLAKA